MNGRMERDNRINIEIKNAIKKSGDCLYMKDFNDSMAATAMSAATRKEYMNAVLRFVTFLRTNRGYDITTSDFLREIRLPDVDAYKVSIQRKANGEETSDTYRVQQMCAIKRFLRYICRYGYRDDDLSVKIDKTIVGKKQKEIVVLSDKEVVTMQKNIYNGVGSKRAVARQKEWQLRDEAILNLGLSTGIRVGALTEINIEDIDFEAHTIHVVEKRKFERYLEIGDDTERILKDWIAKRSELIGDSETHALFISNRRTRISTDAVEKLIKKYAKGIDKKITPHKMRSTFATEMLDQTGNIYLVADCLGHSSITTTKRYAKLNVEAKRSALREMNSKRKWR